MSLIFHLLICRFASPIEPHDQCQRHIQPARIIDAETVVTKRIARPRVPQTIRRDTAAAAERYWREAHSKSQGR